MGNIGSDVLEIVNTYFQNHEKLKITIDNINTNETLIYIENMYKDLLDFSDVDYKEIKTSYSIEKKSYITCFIFDAGYKLQPTTIVTSIKLTDEEIAKNYEFVARLYCNAFCKLIEPYEVMVYNKINDYVCPILEASILHNSPDTLPNLQSLHDVIYKQIECRIIDVVKRNNFSYKQYSMFESILGVEEVTNTLILAYLQKMLQNFDFGKFLKG